MYEHVAIIVHSSLGLRWTIAEERVKHFFCQFRWNKRGKHGENRVKKGNSRPRIFLWRGVKEKKCFRSRKIRDFNSSTCECFCGAESLEVFEHSSDFFVMLFSPQIVLQERNLTCRWPLMANPYQLRAITRNMTVIFWGGEIPQA